MSAVSDKRPVGIFDSGIGGLTVFKEIRRVLPNENLIYIGDTARVPYGTKSKEAITRYSFENVEFLMQKDVKAIVVACNTASSIALEKLNEAYNSLPIVGVINPAVEGLITLDNVKKVGIIGTRATIDSGVYQAKIQKRLSVEVFAESCPLFVPLVEDGLLSNSFVLGIVEHYLSNMKAEKIDTLILACTHYPLLKSVLNYFFEGKVTIVDSAFFAAREIKRVLLNSNLLNSEKLPGNDVFFVTDSADSFKRVGEFFLEKQMDRVERI